MTDADTEQRLRAAWVDDRIGTHWEGCETAHYGCAILALLDTVAELRAQRGTLICEGSTTNPQWTPLGERIVALEAEVAKLRLLVEVIEAKHPLLVDDARRAIARAALGSEAATKGDAHAD